MSCQLIVYCPTLLLWLDTFMLCAKPKPNTKKKKKSNPNQISTPNQNAFPICKSKSKKNQKIYKKSYVSTREFVVSSGARSHLGKSKTKHLKKKRKHRRTIFWVLQTRKKKKKNKTKIFVTVASSSVDSEFYVHLIQASNWSIDPSHPLVHPQKASSFVCLRIFFSFKYMHP